MNTQEYWIPKERLGVLEPLIANMLDASAKRDRVNIFKAIQTVLKRLKLIPGNCTITRIGIACDRVGALGLLLSGFMPSEIDAQLPDSGANYAHERSKDVDS